MGFNNPDVSWSELERALSGKPRDGASLVGATPPGMPGDGGDSPAWSRKRSPYRPPEEPPAVAHAATRVP
ncbi:MAG: error-prone polymerase [Pseudonocardiales bacterium]|nr:error-prone polymerase [Pseudonocardiales bacterium]